VSPRRAIGEAEARLAAAGVETPRVDAEWLVAYVLRVPRSLLYDAGDVDAALLEPLLRRRERREPLAYVLGEWGFRRLTLKTDRRALVPRPETETLVERALALIEDVDEPRVLDVGVGGGAIALAIKDERPRARVTGIDASPAALELARENAATLGVDVELRAGDVDVAAEGWDLVVANPPYVAREALPTLQPELQWEPREALVGDGFHVEIARVAATRAIAFEVADGEARAVAASLAELGYERIAITRDLAGTERVVEGRSG
jgi:release factor glutamine methyltransferase